MTVLPFERALAESWPPAAWAEVSVLVAVSGGADSVALLSALAALKSAGSGHLIVAHFNHGLRQHAADADEAFVHDMAEQFRLPLIVGRAEGNYSVKESGDGLEAAARTARYRFLLEAAEARGARYVVTAHTADDQVETILHRILRGTGLAGLKGMPRTRALSPAVTLIRPLLAMTRASLETYVAAKGLSFRHDAMNDDSQFTRCRLRHDLLPKLRREYNPAVNEALLRLGQLAGECQGIVEELTHELTSAVKQQSYDTVSIDAQDMAQHPRYLVREVLAAAWRAQGWPLQSMGFQEWEALAEMMLTQQTLAAQVFPGNIRAEKTGQHLVLTRLKV